MTDYSCGLQVLVMVVEAKNEECATTSLPDFKAARLAIEYWLTQAPTPIAARRRCCSLLVELAGPNIRQGTVGSALQHKLLALTCSFFRRESKPCEL